MVYVRVYGMAFVWKKADMRNWIARFTDRSGKRLNRSTGTPQRKLAEKIASQFEDAAKRKRTSRHVRDVILALHREITGDEIKSLTVRQCFAEWIETKTAECQPSTLVFYKIATDKFLKWLGAKADGDIADVTRQDLLAFRGAEAARLAPKTVNHEIKCLRMVFKAAKRDGLVSDNPVEFVETVRNRGEKARRPFTIPELQAVLAAADDEWRSMIIFAFYTGQRLSDIAALIWENLDLARDELRLVTRKTGRTVLIPLPAPLRRHVMKLPSADTPGAPVHPRAFALAVRQGKTGGLSNQFADLLADAGLRSKVAHRKGAGVRRTHELSFHSLRGTATTLLHEAGIPASVAQALIGHDSAEIHQDYVKVGRDALRHAADSMPEIWPQG